MFQMVDFIVGIITSLNIGPDSTRIAAVMFGDIARMVFDLQTFNSIDEFMEYGPNMFQQQVKCIAIIFLGGLVQ